MLFRSPYSIESGVKRSEATQKITYEKIEANVPIDDDRFRTPAVDKKAQPGKDK